MHPIMQFSLIDTRPLHGMTDVCERHNIKLLTYGTLASSLPMKCCATPDNNNQCGGFLSDKWLGQSEPDLYAGDLTPSQRKVSTIIDVRRLSFTAPAFPVFISVP